MYITYILGYLIIWVENENVYVPNSISKIGLWKKLKEPIPAFELELSIPWLGYYSSNT